MDAIKSVEEELEAVLGKFEICRSAYGTMLDQLIEKIKKSKQDICDSISPGQTELNSNQLQEFMTACDTVRSTFAPIPSMHRDVHIAVSRIGKSIDKNFNANFACASDSNLFYSPENKELLNQAIVNHLFRNGMTDVAEELIQEAKLNVNRKDKVKFDEITGILTALQNKDAEPALKWAVKNRDRLRELNSPLEFKIHCMKIIELYKQGIEKQHEIIQYARENLQHLDSVYDLDIQHLMGGIIYLKTGIENSPYKSFLSPINYQEIEHILVTNACALLGMSTRSPISVVVEAGSIALPSLLNINQILTDQGVRNVWQLRDELPVEIDLGRKLQFHSTFSCPILKQQSTESNPPMRLLCGHIISRDALHKLQSNPNNKFKCPYCPIEQTIADAMQVQF